MNFLRNLLAAIVGFFIAIFLLFAFFIGISAVIGSGEEVYVKPKSVLELDLTTPIKDYVQRDDNPLSEFLDLTDEKLGLNHIINAIENAKYDDNIKGISIKTPFINAGIPQTQSIRKKINEFKSSGKFVYAYNDVYTQKNYYLSSVADSLFLNPIGEIDFKGLGTEVLYFKDFEDKYGIKMEVIRHGKYKSAVEPFLENKMSVNNREQITALLNSLWSEIITDIGTERNLSDEKINTIADNLGGRNATLSKENNLIDDAIYEDQYENFLKSKTQSSKLNYISIADYIKSGKGKVSSTATDRIAVIYAQGNILYGKGNEDYIGQELMIKAIRSAVKNSKVKAIVLRVDSPGGSALASELIWRELELAKKHKPLVVSMGNSAASGGYYIAAGADKIVAEPTTITGSIGVFGILPNAYELSQRIGINAEQVNTNKNNGYSVFEPMNPNFYNATKESVEKTYSTFVQRVASGRNMSIESVNEIAQGRVWTGAQAKENDLVDELGNLETAINIAADLAEIGDYKIRNYPNYKIDFKDAFKMMPFAKVDKEAIIKETLGDAQYKLYHQLESLKTLKGIQARMPYILEVN